MKKQEFLQITDRILRENFTPERNRTKILSQVEHEFKELWDELEVRDEINRSTEPDTEEKTEEDKIDKVPF